MLVTFGTRSYLLHYNIYNVRTAFVCSGYGTMVTEVSMH